MLYASLELSLTRLSSSRRKSSYGLGQVFPLSLGLTEGKVE
jgi:hypothetical protein